MIIPGLIRNPEPDYDLIEKRGIGQGHAAFRKVFSSGEYEFIDSNRNSFGSEQRRVGSTIDVGNGTAAALTVGCGNAEQVDPYPGGRTT